MRWEYKTINFTKRSFFTGTLIAEAFDIQLNELGARLGVGKCDARQNASWRDCSL